MPRFVDITAKDIDNRLRELKDEAARLEAARAVLTSGRRRPSRTAGTATTRAHARSAGHQNGRPTAGPARRNGNTRADQVLELVGKRPGITIPELAQAMKIQPNYLYRVLPRLALDGGVRRDGQGWHPSSSPTAVPAAPSGNAPARGRARRAKSEPQVSATRSVRSRRGTQPASGNGGRSARGATRASVLAALAGGKAMTATQVATKAGMARPTVSTTLSKLAKSGEVEKAERGYRIATNA